MKRLFLALLILALALAWLPALGEEASNGYGVYVGGVEVTPDNQEDVLGDGTVSYGSGTIYLKGAAIAGATLVPGEEGADALVAIYSKGDLKIQVRDKCVIGYFGTPLTDAAWYGIRCDGKLTVSGTSTDESILLISVCGADGTVQAYEAFGIFSAGDMEVSSCVIQSSCETAADGYTDSVQHGVLCNGKLKIRGALLAGYTADQALADGTAGVEIHNLEYETAVILGMSGNSGFTFGGMMTENEFTNLAYQQMFNPLQVVSGDNYDGSGTTMDQLKSFLNSGYARKYVVIQPGQKLF